MGLHPAGREVYPVSKRVEASIHAAVRGTQPITSEDGRPYNQIQLAKDLLEYLGEWEHDRSIQAEAMVTNPSVQQAGEILEDFFKWVLWTGSRGNK